MVLAAVGLDQDTFLGVVLPACLATKSYSAACIASVVSLAYSPTLFDCY